MAKNLTYHIQCVFIILLVSMVSCSSDEDTAGYNASGDRTVTLEKGIATAQAPSRPPAPQNDVQEIERKLIKEGRIEFETGDLSSTKKTITDAITKYDGYTSSDREFKSPGRRSNRMVIRVPADNFDTLLTEISKGVDKFDNKEIETKDVTEEFVDIQARLKTKNELENRYLELLEKATSVKDMLAIENQIGQLRSEIESIEGRLKYLKNQVAYATLSVTFYEEVAGETAFGEKLKEGFKEGWNSFISFFVWLISTWPFILLAVILLLVLKWWWKSRKVKKAI